MTGEEKQDERRSAERYYVTGGCVVLDSAYSSHYFQLGDLLDISPEGVAFRYIGKKRPTNEVIEITIVYCKHNFCLTALMSKSVSDVAIKAKNGHHVPMRRWGLKFGELTPEQRFRIKEFIARRAAVEV